MPGVHGEPETTLYVFGALERHWDTLYTLLQRTCSSITFRALSRASGPLFRCPSGALSALLVQLSFLSFAFQNMLHAPAAYETSMEHVTV
jgi:hypothetical protein